MVGHRIADPHGVEGDPGASVDGLGLLDVRTDFTVDKNLSLPTARALGVPATGYEIHHSRVTPQSRVEEFLGGARSGTVFGTMWHGSLEGDELRGALLAEMLGRTPSRVSFPAAREARLDRLGDLVEAHLDVDALLGLARADAPDAGTAARRRRMRLLILGGTSEDESSRHVWWTKVLTSRPRWQVGWLGPVHPPEQFVPAAPEASRPCAAPWPAAPQQTATP